MAAFGTLQQGAGAAGHSAMVEEAAERGRLRAELDDAQRQVAAAKQKRKESERHMGQVALEHSQLQMEMASLRSKKEELSHQASQAIHRHPTPASLPSKPMPKCRANSGSSSSGGAQKKVQATCSQSAPPQTADSMDRAAGVGVKLETVAVAPVQSVLKKPAHKSRPGAGGSTVQGAVDPGSDNAMQTRGAYFYEPSHLESTPQPFIQQLKDDILTLKGIS